MAAAVACYPEDKEAPMRHAFDRVTVDPKRMGGVPCLRGLRIPVATVVGLVADGMSTTEILAAYPDLEPEDVAQALRFAAYLAKDRGVPLTAAS
jgi:uncharacterized protein (DUF433 family)